MRPQPKLLFVTLIFLLTACGQSPVVATEPPSSQDDNQQPEDNPPTNADTVGNQPTEEASPAAGEDPSPVPSRPTPTPKPTATPQPTNEPSYFKVLYDKVEFKVYLPTGFSKDKPRRLAIFLHGDTANGYFENYYISLKDYALKHGLIFVAALSPNRNSWWHENAFADDLHKALTTLKKRLNFSAHDVLWSGVSGGSTFLTMQFIPKVGKYYSGIVAATCGGAPSNLFSNADLPLLKASYSLNFVYGDQDYLADPQGTYGDVIPKTIMQYKNYGFPVAKKILLNTTHCAFDVNTEIIKIWDSY